MREIRVFPVNPLGRKGPRAKMLLTDVATNALLRLAIELDLFRKGKRVAAFHRNVGEVDRACAVEERLVQVGLAH